MRLNVSRLVMRRGSIIEVSWDAEGMGMPQLAITISGREIIMNVEAKGTKLFRINGTTFRNSIALKACDQKGQQHCVRRSVYTFGREKDGERYDNYVRITPIRQYAGYVKDFWRRYPPEKRRLYLILVFLTLSLIFVNRNPDIAQIAIIAAIVYTTYHLFKR